MLKTLYCGIAAYRKGVAKAVDALSAWLVKVLDVVPLEQCVPESVLLACYRSLGLDAEKLDTVASEMRLIWVPDKERLLVSERYVQ
eukprot:1868974-Amphidinium_carterae.8